MYAKYIAPHHKMIRYWLQKHTSNHEMVEDYYAEMLRDLFLYIDTYDEKKEIIPWIIVALQRKIAYFHKRDRKEQEKQVVLNEHYASKTLKDEVYYEVGEGSMQFEDIREKLGDPMLLALQELNPECRSTFLLRASGYLPKDIADLEYKGEGAAPLELVEEVRARIRYAKKFLKSRLNCDGSAKKTARAQKALNSRMQDSDGGQRAKRIDGTWFD